MEQVKSNPWRHHENGACLEGYGEGDECMLSPVFPPSKHGSLFLLQGKNKGHLMWEWRLSSLRAARSLAANYLIAISLPPGEYREAMLLQVSQWGKAMEMLSEFVEAQSVD
jgi:hypothetical protein